MTPDTEYLTGMIAAYVPEAGQLPLVEAMALAVERDQQAAADLASDAETQLNLSAAVLAANAELDKVFQELDWTSFIGTELIGNSN